MGQQPRRGPFRLASSHQSPTEAISPVYATASVPSRRPLGAVRASSRRLIPIRALLGAHHRACGAWDQSSMTKPRFRPSE
jgi:hypothetical protein